MLREQDLNVILLHGTLYEDFSFMITKKQEHSNNNVFRKTWDDNPKKCLYFVKLGDIDSERFWVHKPAKVVLFTKVV